MILPKFFVFRKILGLALISMLALSVYYWWSIYLPKQYKDFLQKEREAIPLFDQLNEDVAKKLPPLPSNSSVQMKGSVGIGLAGIEMYMHGRILQMEISTTHPPDLIVKYYDATLIKQGWNKDTNKYNAADYAIYYKGTSCIKIDATSHMYPNYEIFIWHDYKHQEFAPERPKYISRFESDMATFLKCP